MDPSPSEDRRFTWVAGGVGLALVLAPVFLTPVLPTQDGPSHLYNAFLAHRLAAGEALFTPFLELGPGLWPNRFTHYLLTAVGPVAGWSAAERVTAGLAAGLPYLALIWWTRERVGRTGVFVLAAGLWMAGSWFFWKGFFDFSVSLAPFLGVAVLLGRMEGGDPRRSAAGGIDAGPAVGGVDDAGQTPGLRLHLALQTMLGLALLSHLFTFAVALALAGFVLAARVLRRRLHPRHLAALLPGVAALAGLLLTGALGGGEMHWYPWEVAVSVFTSAGWAAVLPTASWPGRVILVILAAAPFLRLALGRDEGGRRLDPFEVFALLGLGASLLIPAQVGTGQYAQERLRLLSLLLLTPSAAAVSARLVDRRLVHWLVPAVGAGVALIFAVRSVEIIRHAGQIEEDLRAMDRVLAEHDVEPGDWIAATHWNPYGPFQRIVPYVHLHDRLAIHRELVVLDNYEARMPIFPVRWKETPHRPDFVRLQRGARLAWLVEITRGERPWKDPLLVLHESRHPLVSRAPELGGGGGTDVGAYGITELLWLSAPASDTTP